MKSYISINDGGTYFTIDNVEKQSKLSPGCYEVGYSDAYGILFTKIKTNYDAIIHLPNGQFDRIVEEFNTFLKEETKAKFDKWGFLYKRSALLHGLPGTGKTVIVNRVAEDIVKRGGIVLFNPDPRRLVEAFRILDLLQPETIVMVIYEELDQWLQNNEKTFLNVLDGEVQKKGVVYLATTNYIDKVPARIQRPGRFSSVIEITYPTEEARRHYLETKGMGKKWAAAVAKETKNFSIDELKEVVLSVTCLDKPVKEAVEKIRRGKGDTTPVQVGLFSGLAMHFADTLASSLIKYDKKRDNDDYEDEEAA